jgi:hypothetical protein
MRALVVGILVGLAALAGWGALTIAAAEVGEWIRVAGPPIAPESGPLVALPNGDLLVFARDTVERYVTATGTWIIAGHLNALNDVEDAALLVDGTVLAIGRGSPAGAAPEASSETFDPGTGLGSTASRLQFPRARARVSRLGSGKVLVSGGRNSGGPLVAPTELYDPTSARRARSRWSESQATRQCR